MDLKSETGRDQVLMLLLTLSAAVIRAPGLGEWCLGSDEFYLSQSVRFILEKGVPEYPSGGYYIRGIGLQYMTALVASVIQDRELQIRLLPAIFGVLTVPLFYRLSRLFMPALPSFLAALVLVMSSWHIEFSRFGRFYTPFQFFFVLFLYCLYMGYWRQSRRHAIASWLVAYLTVFLFEGAVFLPVLYLLVLFREEPLGTGRAARILLMAGLLLVLNYAVNGVGYRNAGVDDPLPKESVGAPAPRQAISIGPLKLPKTDLLQAALDSPATAVGFAALSLLALFLLYGRIKVNPKLDEALLGGLAVLFPLIHQYGLFLFLLAFLVLCRKGLFPRERREILLWAAFLSASLAFWGFMIFRTGHEQPMNALLGYPPVKYAVLIPFRKTVPIWGMLTAAWIVFSMIRNIFEKNARSAFPLLISVTSVALISLFTTPYRLTRYTFFLLPLLILIPFIDMNDSAEKLRGRSGSTAARFSWGLLLLPLAAFFAGDDFHPRHIASVSSADLNFRLNGYTGFEEHWYPRRDFESTAAYVNRGFGNGDLIVIDAIATAAYLRQPYLFYSNSRSPWFQTYSRKGGAEEIWTGSPMIHSRTRSLDAIRSVLPAGEDRSVWFISGESLPDGRTVVGGETGSPIALEIMRRYKGIDERMNVYQIRRADG